MHRFRVAVSGPGVDLPFNGYLGRSFNLTSFRLHLIFLIFHHLLKNTSFPLIILLFRFSHLWGANLPLAVDQFNLNREKENWMPNVYVSCATNGDVEKDSACC